VFYVQSVALWKRTDPYWLVWRLRWRVWIMWGAGSKSRRGDPAEFNHCFIPIRHRGVYSYFYFGVASFDLRHKLRRFSLLIARGHYVTNLLLQVTVKWQSLRSTKLWFLSFLKTLFCSAVFIWWLCAPSERHAAQQYYFNGRNLKKKFQIFPL